MDIPLNLLNFEFESKPLIIGGVAMEYYGLRKAGIDIDLIATHHDHSRLIQQYPNNLKDLFGDIGVCEFSFEIWNQICTFDYDFLSVGAIEHERYLVISLEKLLFLKAIALSVPKCMHDLELIVNLVRKKAYGKT